MAFQPGPSFKKIEFLKNTLYKNVRTSSDFSIFCIFSVFFDFFDFWGPIRSGRADFGRRRNFWISDFWGSNDVSNFFKNRFLGRVAHEKIFLFDENFFSTTVDWHRNENFFWSKNFFFVRFGVAKIFFKFLKIFKIVFFCKNFFCYRCNFFRRVARKNFFWIGRGGSKTGPRGSKIEKKGGSEGGQNAFQKKSKKTTPWDFFDHFFEKTWTRYARVLSQILNTFFLNFNSAIFGGFRTNFPVQKSGGVCYNTSTSIFYKKIFLIL